MLTRIHRNWTRLIWSLPILAIAVFSVLAARNSNQPQTEAPTGPFKLVSEIKVQPLTEEEMRSQVDYDTTVKVVIGHQGSTPNWWGSAASQEKLAFDHQQDMHLINEHGKRINLYFQPHGNHFSPFTRFEWFYDKAQKKYVIVYRIYTGYIPSDTEKIIFRTQIALQDRHMVPLSVVVRDKK